MFFHFGSPCVESINWVILTREDYLDPLRLRVISCQESRVPQRRWDCGLLGSGRQGQQQQPTWLWRLAVGEGPVGHRIGLRHGVERMVRRRPGAEDTQGRGARNRHGVGVHDASPGVLACVPRGRLV